MITRRKFVTGGVALAASLMGTAINAKMRKQVRLLTWGVTWETSIKTLAVEFTKETGIEVMPVTQASSGEGLIKLKAMQKAPTIDMWLTTQSVAVRATGDLPELFQKIDGAEVPNLKYLSSGAHGPKYAALYAYPMEVIFRPDMMKLQIQHWSDLWDKGLKQSLILPSMGMYQGRTLAIAALRNATSVEPQYARFDANLGFKNLKALTPNVAVFYDSDGQARRSLAQGEGSILVAPTSQGLRVRDAGVSVKMVAPIPSIMNYDVATIVRTPNGKLAMEFLNYLLSAKANTHFGTDLNMIPANQTIKPPASLADVLPPLNGRLDLDEQYINANIATWTERFNREIVA